MASICKPGLSLVIVTLACLVSAKNSISSEPKRPPNLLIIIADDLGWRDVGYHGSEIKTPTLDKLASWRSSLGPELRLSNLLADAGRHSHGSKPEPVRHTWPDRGPQRAKPAAEDAHAGVDARQAAAIPTALFGKWHLGLRPEVGPRKYGFERSYGYFHGQIDQYTHRYKNGDPSWHRDDAFVDEKGHATDLIAAEAVQFLSKKRDNPFFLWVAFSVPHHPVQEEDKWRVPYQGAIKDDSRRQFAASVTHMDSAVGRIIETLEKSGQLENTLILFSSDNGGQQDYSSKTEYEGKHGPYPTLGDNKPLRGWKGELYEGGIRVPAFVHWAGKLKPRRLEQTISYLDWLAKLSRVAGEEVNPGLKLAGRDVGPLLRGEMKAVPDVPLYWNTGNRRGLIDGDWKLIASRAKSADVFELFDLKADPEEKELAGDKPEKAAALTMMMEGEVIALDAAPSHSRHIISLSKEAFMLVRWRRFQSRAYRQQTAAAEGFDRAFTMADSQAAFWFRSRPFWRP